MARAGPTIMWFGEFIFCADHLSLITDYDSAPWVMMALLPRLILGAVLHQVEMDSTHCVNGMSPSRTDLWKPLRRRRGERPETGTIGLERSLVERGDMTKGIAAI